MIGRCFGSIRWRVGVYRYCFGVTAVSRKQLCMGSTANIRERHVGGVRWIDDESWASVQRIQVALKTWLILSICTRTK